LPSDPHFSLEENANEYLDDFGDWEAIGVGGKKIGQYMISGVLGAYLKSEI
jgi:hypothetical protein